MVDNSGAGASVNSSPALGLGAGRIRPNQALLGSLKSLEEGERGQKVANAPASPDPLSLAGSLARL